MLRKLSKNEMHTCFGGAISWVVVLCAVGGGVAVYKMMTSKSGSFTLGPLRTTWGK